MNTKIFYAGFQGELAKELLREAMPHAVGTYQKFDFLHVEQK